MKFQHPKRGRKLWAKFIASLMPRNLQLLNFLSLAKRAQKSTGFKCSGTSDVLWHFPIFDNWEYIDVANDRCLIRHVFILYTLQIGILVVGKYGGWGRE